MPIKSQATVDLIDHLRNHDAIKNQLCKNLDHILKTTLKQMINFNLDIDEINLPIYQDLIVKAATKLKLNNQKYLMNWQHLTNLNPTAFQKQMHLQTLTKQQKIVSTNYNQILVANLIDKTFNQLLIGELLFKYDNCILNNYDFQWLKLPPINELQLTEYLEISEVLTQQIVKILYQHSNL